MISIFSRFSKITAAAVALSMLGACGKVDDTSSDTSTAPAPTEAVTEAEPITTDVQQATAPEIITTAPLTPSIIVTDSSGNNIDQTLPQGTSSPNSAFYQERLYVTGDSICHGFNVFGFVPEEHCITQGSVSMWNRDYFYFDTPYGSYQMIDAIAALQPKLLYMSLGMNDVNMGDAQAYADRYAETALQILERVPDINIVIATITPIDENVTDFTSNNIIREFNSALTAKINSLNNDRIYIFDAYSVVVDPNTLSLRAGGTSGDGIHLSTQCYTDFLDSLFMFLDKTPVMSHIQDSEAGQQ